MGKGWAAIGGDWGGKGCEDRWGWVGMTGGRDGMEEMGVWGQYSSAESPPGAMATACPLCEGSAALVRDLKQRGLLDDTLVIWGGEFGRTPYAQGTANREKYGRDHHGRCFSTWVAGGGVKGGVSYGATDDYSYNIVENPVHIRDLNATLLHCLGMDHNRFTFRFQGLNHKPTGVEPAKVVKGILT